MGTLLAASACGVGGVAGPSSGSGIARELSGHVIDDGADLPGGHNAPIPGVRIEVLDGPKKGTVVVTDSGGNYRLPALLASPVTVSASKAGFDGATETFYPEYFAAPFFRLGQPPHTLWGVIVLAGTTATAVPSVRVEILDGPNGGKATMADENGRFEFNDLLASSSMLVRLSKERHQPRVYSVTDFRYNQRRNFQIESE